jgi:2-methylisocitrate lyase-like PEP mutase family enzyme
MDHIFTACKFVLGKRFVSTSSKKKTTQLKQLLSSPQLSFLMEAHSGLSARIVQEAGTTCLKAAACQICLTTTDYSIRDMADSLNQT